MENNRLLFAKLLWGKVRRFAYCLFRRGYVKAQQQKRSGACIRCGACCLLPTKCIFLRAKGGLRYCMIYRFRPPNCRVFPINRRDIRERNMVRPGTPCGHTFRR